MENHHAIKFGKPSISMGHLYHGELLVITRPGTHLHWNTSIFRHPRLHRIEIRRPKFLCLRSESSPSAVRSFARNHSDVRTVILAV